MCDDEELGEGFGRWIRRIAAIAIVAAAAGYLYYRRVQSPPTKTPRENLAILRDHRAPLSARHGAAGALKSDPSTVPDLIAELERGDDQGRFLAAMALGSMGTRAGTATEAMIRAGGDTFPAVRRQVAASLSKISDDHDLVVASLDPLLHDSDVETRGLAFGSLSSQGDPGTRALMRLLDDPDVDVRRRAATRLVSTAGGEKVAQALRRALADEDAEVRAAALMSLHYLDAVDFRELAGTIGEAKLLTAVYHLVSSLKADAQPAVPFLRDTLQSHDSEAASTAATALGMIGLPAREASLDLMELTDDRRPRIGWTALDALAKIGLESEFRPPHLWQELEAVTDDVYCLNLDPGALPSLPSLTPTPKYVATDLALDHIARLGKLRLLVLSHTSVGDAGLAHLAALKNLERLHLAKTSVSSEGLLHLAELGALRSLNLNDCAVDDEGLRHLAKLRRLETLRLSGTRITDAGLAHLSGLTELRHLSLPAQVTDAGLAYLRGATGLEEIMGGQFSPRAVAQFPNLTSVGLHLPSTTDDDLAPLAQLPHLRTVRLQGTAITDVALEFLVHLGRLEDLSIESTAVTDAGLNHLKSLPGLKYLHQDGKKVTGAGIVDLRTALPKLRID